MKGNEITRAQIASSLLMVMALLWLTVSTPFIYSAQQQIEKQMIDTTPDDEADDAPLQTTNEERSENTTSTLSEYLHEAINVERPSVLISKYFKCYPSDIYFAFHPELISPPPEA